MRRRELLGRLLATALAWPARARAASITDDETWTDPARRRELPLRIRWPLEAEPCGVVLFSHGLGGSRGGGAFWGEAWAQAGFLVIHLQHPGSDIGIWSSGMAAVRRAAQLDQYVARVADVGWVIDELARRQAAGGRWGRARLDAVGMSGHSFGARTTQALAGEAPLGASAGSTGPLADPRLRAFIAFSPGFSAREGMRPQDVAQRFGGIRRPMLCITGTKDGSVIGGDANYETRRAVYQGLPPGGKAELVLAGADHYTFGGQSFQTRPGGLIQREPGAAELAAAHQALVARISTDWWLWRLLDDTQAKGRLLAPAGLLPGDSWLQD